MKSILKHEFPSYEDARAFLLLNGWLANGISSTFPWSDEVESDVSYSTVAAYLIQIGFCPDKMSEGMLMKVHAMLRQQGWDPAGDSYTPGAYTPYTP
jgi:hypothetical protein